MPVYDQDPEVQEIPSDSFGQSIRIKCAEAYTVVHPIFRTTAAGGPPVFTVQPQDILAIQGDNVILLAQAEGLQPITYQWRFNGVVIQGATDPSLALPNISSAQGGSYDCVATNPTGSTTSDAATVTVSSKPTAAIYLGNAGYNQPPTYTEAEIKAWYQSLPGVTPVYRTGAAGSYQIAATSPPTSNEFRCFAFPASFITGQLQFTSAGAELGMDALAGTVTVDGQPYRLYRTKVRSAGDFTFDGGTAIIVTQ